ncbi:MAG: S41 family peptidase, partial [Rhodospirillales bacterium]|nr:S41 family peptidase [Rhodospirillales bacterium]MCW9039422.1 S41 family peptidase [Rhodospirillales bacterium]
MNWFRIRPYMIVAAGLVVGFSLSPGLSGCAAEQSMIERFLGHVVGHDFSLDEESRRELARYRAVYDEYASQDGRDEDYVYFVEAFRYVRANYYKKPEDAQLVDFAIEGVRKMEGAPGSLSPVAVNEAALDAMLVGLDPHSSYLNPDEAREMQVSTKGEFGGLGIEVTMDEKGVKVISPIEDTPAERAGIKAGDLIVKLEGESVAGWSLVKAVMRMRGKPGVPLNLTVERTGLAPFDLTIVRDVIKVRSVRWRMEGDLGYVRVVKFTEKVSDGIRKAMSALRKEGGDNLKGIVLDLRNNPGGLLDQSVALADAFLDDGLVVAIRGRKPGESRTFDARSGDLARGLPMVVLINEGSASASEIVAGALQDHKRAIVMGARSFGKGSVQTIAPMGNKGALRLTTSLYYLPSGHAIQSAGVVPDIEVPVKVDHEIKREADLTGALPMVEENNIRARITLKHDACIPIGEAKDYQLGCAVSFLHAGSTDRFLAEVGH